MQVVQLDGFALSAELRQLIPALIQAKVARVTISTRTR